MTTTANTLHFSSPTDASDATAAFFESDILALPQGRTAVAWGNDDNSAILLRFFADNGSPEGPAVEITTPGQDGNRPSLVLLENGNLMVTFTSLATPTNATINAQVVSPNGQAIGPQQVVFADADNTSVSPSTLALSNGEVLTSFNNFGRDGSLFGVFVQRTDDTGTPIGAVIQVNQTTDSFQSDGRLIELNDGGFGVTWESRNVDGSSNAVMFRAYDADGTPRGNEMRLNQFSLGRQENPEVARLSDGRLVVTWESDDQDGSDDGVYAQILNENGARVGSEFRVNTTTLDDQSRSSIVETPDGGFVIAWHNRVNDNTIDIRFQRFDATANPIGSETIIVSEAGVINQGPELTIGEDGLVRVAWLSSVFNTLDATVRTATSDALDGGSIGNDYLVGAGVSDDILGLSGDDTILGGGGNDTLAGGFGNDTLEGGAGRDSLSGGADSDTISGGASNDTVAGDNGRDLVFLNQGNDLFLDNTQGGVFGQDTVFGGFGSDTIEGGNGDDVFYGEWGSDVINARSGNDLVFGGDQDDTISAGEGQDTVFGGNGRDTVFLNAGDDLFNDNTQGGVAGQDTVRGGFGDDTINGGNGDDQFFGEWDDDLIFGRLGNDIIGGGSGSDTLNGGAGSDTLTGGGGVDTFVFNAVDAADGTDLVTDFQLDLDVLQIVGASESASSVSYDSDANEATISVQGNTVAVLRSAQDLGSFGLDDITFL